MAGFFYCLNDDLKFDWGGTWWIGVFVFAIGLLIWAKRRLKQQSITGLVDFMARSKFKIATTPTPFSREYAPAMRLFSNGRSKTFGYLLEGSVQEQLVFLFNYSYIFGLHTQKTFSQTVAAFPIPLGRLAAFDLYPSTFLDRIGAVFGMKTLEIPDRKLARRYLFRSAAGPSAYNVLNPDLLNLLNQSKKDWWLESSGAWLLVYQRDKSWITSGDLQQFMSEASEFARLLLPVASPVR